MTVVVVVVVVVWRSVVRGWITTIGDMVSQELESRREQER